jgi:hypothetical protein
MECSNCLIAQDAFSDISAKTTSMENIELSQLTNDLKTLYLKLGMFLLRAACL